MATGAESIMCASKLSVLSYSKISLLPISGSSQGMLDGVKGSRGQRCHMRHKAHRRRQLGTNEVEINYFGLLKFLFSISETCLNPPTVFRVRCSLRSGEAEGVKIEALTRG
jgi:hypothetical protein